MKIRRATADDAGDLHDLYFNHLTANPPKETQDISLWRDMISRFENDPFYYVFVGVEDNRIVSSVTIVIIENLTHNLRPYALIENVVTHTDYRGRHYATELIKYTSEIANKHGCYKIMLLSGSKAETTLRFYESCGFNRNDKTAFVKWL